jgi:hypothetical protein
MKKKLIAGGVAAVATLATAGVATAGTLNSDTAQEGNAAASSKVAAGSSALVRPMRCDGGFQKRVYNRIVDQPIVFGEAAAFTKIPGAEVSFFGPGKGLDTVSVTFSAEAQLRGNVSNDLFDWAELEVRLNGVPMEPAGGPGDPMALTGTSTYNMNAAQFCGKVRRGVNNISAWTKVVDNGNDDAESVWLDDYVLRVEQSE